MLLARQLRWRSWLAVNNVYSDRFGILELQTVGLFETLELFGAILCFLSVVYFHEHTLYIGCIGDITLFRCEAPEISKVDKLMMTFSFQ